MPVDYAELPRGAAHTLNMGPMEHPNGGTSGSRAVAGKRKAALHAMKTVSETFTGKAGKKQKAVSAASREKPITPEAAAEPAPSAIGKQHLTNGARVAAPIQAATAKEVPKVAATPAGKAIPARIKHTKGAAAAARNAAAAAAAVVSAVPLLAKAEATTAVETSGSAVAALAASDNLIFCDGIALGRSKRRSVAQLRDDAAARAQQRIEAADIEDAAAEAEEAAEQAAEGGSPKIERTLPVVPAPRRRKAKGKSHKKKVPVTAPVAVAVTGVAAITGDPLPVKNGLVTGRKPAAKRKSSWKSSPVADVNSEGTSTEASTADAAVVSVSVPDTVAPAGPAEEQPAIAASAAKAASSPAAVAVLTAAAVSLPVASLTAPAADALNPESVSPVTAVAPLPSALPVATAAKLQTAAAQATAAIPSPIMTAGTASMPTLIPAAAPKSFAMPPLVLPPPEASTAVTAMPASTGASHAMPPSPSDVAPAVALPRVTPALLVIGTEEPKKKGGWPKGKSRKNHKAAEKKVDVKAGGSKPRGVGTQRRPTGKHSKAHPETPPDTSEDEEMAPQECWLRPNLRPNRTLVIRNKYDSGSDTEMGDLADSSSGVDPSGAKSVATPSRHSVVHAIGEVDTKEDKKSAEDSEGEECRWGVRRRGPPRSAKTDKLLGCPKCRWLKNGCGACRERPTMERPSLRWKPTEGRPQDGIPEAMTFRPTEEEFADPLKYINSIRAQAEKCGIACVVPPPSFMPPFALDKGTNGVSADSFRFAIRKQLTSHLCMRLANAPKEAAGPARGYGATLKAEGDNDDEFGFFTIDKRHTMKSFMAYADWIKSVHFSEPAPGSQTSKGQAANQTSTAQPKKKRRITPYVGPEPSVEEIEAEFWRIVETPDDVYESLYGQDLDSGHHGSGLPLPPFRQALLERHLAAQQAAGLLRKTSHKKRNVEAEEPPDLETEREEAARAEAEAAREKEYSLHGWNINNLPRHQGSVLRYLEGEELITGVQVPWLYVGSALSAFCWHVEDHALYSVNYHHMGAPKVWYGVPAHASKALEDAIKDALPHLFETAPNLLYQLVTMVSPKQLLARGVPVHRLVHEEGSFVITFPNAYHSGFNTGFNCAEAVNFGPPDWLPYGSDRAQKYREDEKPLTLSHDALLVTLVRAAEKVRARADAEGHSLAGSVSPFAEYQQVLRCAARAAEEVARAAAKAPPLPVFAAIPVAVSLVEKQRAANSASALSPAVEGEVDLNVLAAAFTSGAMPTSPTSPAPSKPPGVTAATVPPPVARSEHHTAAAAGGAAPGVSPMVMDGGGSAQGDVVMEDALDTAVQESAAASAGQATLSPPLASAEAVASDMAMLGSIVGGELGELDPVFYDTVPAQGIRLAAGELVLRVGEERIRWAGMQKSAPATETRMHGSVGAKDSHGLYTNTADVDCSACKSDLWLSAVVSRAAPGIAVCPEHAAMLPGSPQDKTLLFRYTFEELEAMVATAVELIDGTAEAVEFAKQRRQLWKEMRPEIKKLGPMCVQSRNAAGELEVAVMPAFAAGGPLPKLAGRAPQRKAAAKQKAQPKQPLASRAKALPSIALPPELLPPAPVSTALLSRALPCSPPAAAPSGEGIGATPSLTASVVQHCIQSAQQRAEELHASAMVAGVHTQPEALPTRSGEPLPDTAKASSIALSLVSLPAASPTAAVSIPEQTHAGGLQAMEESVRAVAPLPLPTAVWLPTPEASKGIPAATAEPISSLVASTEDSTASDPLWEPPAAKVILGVVSMMEAALKSSSCLPAAIPASGLSNGATAEVHAVHESPAEAVPLSVPQAVSLAAGDSVYVAAQGLLITPVVNGEYAGVNAASSLAVDPSQMQGLDAVGMKAPGLEISSDPVDLFLNDSPL